MPKGMRYEDETKRTYLDLPSTAHSPESRSYFSGVVKFVVGYSG